MVLGLSLKGITQTGARHSAPSALHNSFDGRRGSPARFQKWYVVSHFSHTLGDKVNVLAADAVVLFGVGTTPLLLTP
jgi:hypothetical protein